MRNLRFSLSLLAGAVLALAFTTSANAQATRTWVSGLGDDANPCSRTAPCKTFPGAYSRTAVGGEIDCMDPGGFGNISIGHSLTIDCDTGMGSILASSGTTGININAASTDVIYIKNLNINGVSKSAFAGGTGINITGGEVHLMEVTIFGFPTACVNVNASANAQLTIVDSSFTDCGTTGVGLSTTSGTVLADFKDLRIWNSSTGINAGNGARLNVTGSVISQNTIGLSQTGVSGGGSTVLISGSTMSANGTALQSSAGSFIGASGNTFVNTITIVYNTAGGGIYTGNDNASFGNTGTGATSGAVPKI